eukprot:GHVH01004528.1.p1 GENE.GHVH01004528.1~~GHVH01004528.1.p1  ORF type:complete len:696 (+),score=77.41 GHVH01004528.1:282-2090(+)
MKHSGIISHHGVMESRERLFLVVDEPCGESLLQMVTLQGTPAEDQLRFVLDQLAKSLLFIHTHGLIHGNVTLDNVSISGQVTPGYFNVKLEGFAFSETLTAPGPEYDVRSLGLLVYSVVALEAPVTQELREEDFSKRFQWYHPLLKDLVIKMISRSEGVQMNSLEEVLNHPFISSLPRPPDAPPLVGLSGSIDLRGFDHMKDVDGASAMRQDRQKIHLMKDPSSLLDKYNAGIVSGLLKMNIDNHDTKSTNSIAWCCQLPNSEDVTSLTESTASCYQFRTPEDVTSLMKILSSIIRDLHSICHNEGSAMILYERMLKLTSGSRPLMSQACCTFDRVRWRTDRAREAAVFEDPLIAIDDILDSNTLVSSNLMDCVIMRESIGKLEGDLSHLLTQSYRRKISYDGSVHKQIADAMVSPTLMSRSWDDSVQETDCESESLKKVFRRDEIKVGAQAVLSMDEDSTKYDLKKKLEESLATSNNWFNYLKVLRKVRSSINVVLRFWDSLILTYDSILGLHHWMGRISLRWKANYSRPDTELFLRRRFDRTLIQYAQQWSDLGNVLKSYEESIIQVIEESSNLQNETDDSSSHLLQNKLKSLIDEVLSK